MGVQNTTHAVIVEQGEQNVNKTSSIGLCGGGGRSGSPKNTQTHRRSIHYHHQESLEGWNCCLSQVRRAGWFGKMYHAMLMN